MKIMTNELAIWKIASTDENRKALHYIHFVHDGNGVAFLEATNGGSAVRHAIEAVGVDAFELFVHKDELKRVAQLRKPKKKGRVEQSYLGVVCTGGEYRVEVEHEVAECISADTFAEMFGVRTGVLYDKVFAPRSEATIEYAVNAELLAAMQATLVEYPTLNSVILSFRSGDDGGVSPVHGVFVRGAGCKEQTIGLCMPIRMGSC